MTSEKEQIDSSCSLPYKHRFCGNCVHFYEDEGCSICNYIWMHVERTDCPADFKTCEWVATSKSEMETRTKMWMEKHMKFLREVNET